jgi:radical SAM superfamily enzyme YgiQ (UPF0313 family)
MIVKDDLSKILVGGKKALLINPPIYDTQYWAYWAQPHGLLKVATWLQSVGYTDLRLIDCLATDEKRRVHHRLLDKVQRDNITKIRRAFGMSFDELRQHLQEHANGIRFRPDEIWITSIMTYWWESTRDVIELIEEVFGKPVPRILVGGIYPTLYPEHADKNLRKRTNLRDEELVIVDGEICPEAANARTDLSLYEDPALYSARPKYAIITGSRGCPFDCAYCAQLKLNDNNRRIRNRTPEDIADEIEDKQKRFGIREFAFYEDNLLFNRQDFLDRLSAIRKRGLKIEIYAPEGIEPRLVEHELMTEMRAAGFKKVHLALETVDNDISRKWNRRQATIEKFDKAVDILKQVGFRVGSQDMNAFVIFGIPDEDLQAAVNTAVYASIRVGSVVPMLFTPVPGSILFNSHKSYLEFQHHPDGTPWELHDYNGKLLPFLEYNQRKNANLRASDYLEIESLMMHLNNSKVLQKRFDINSNSQVGKTFRKTLAAIP